MNRLKNLRRRSNKKAHKTKNPTLLWGFISCDPVWIRTKDLLLRRQLLYPAELRDRYNQKRGMIAHPPCRGGRIRTCDLLVPNQARWPDYATPRTEVRYGLNLVAVGAGFEPAVQLPVRQFSKLLVSASHPSHHVFNERMAKVQKHSVF